MNGVEGLEAVLTLEQAQELGDSNPGSPVGDASSIHKLLDDLLGSFEEDDCAMF